MIIIFKLCSSGACPALLLIGKILSILLLTGITGCTALHADS